MNRSMLKAPCAHLVAALMIGMSLALFLIAASTQASDGAAAQSGERYWIQSSVSGFGSTQNHHISSLGVFGGQMYAGTWNEDGAQVWRTADGKNWSPFTPGWSASNTVVNVLQPFGNYLYVGVESLTEGGGIWRTNGANWAEVASAGLGDDNNYGVNAITVFSDTLIAATANFTTGVEIWRSATGDAGSWAQVNADGFGLGGGTGDVVMDVYDDYLYVGLGRWPGSAELWRTDDQVTWTPVFTDGLGSPDNSHVSSMAEFKGHFYIGLRNGATAGQVWRSDNGLNWTPVFTNGLGDTANARPYGLIVFDDQLYLVFSNFVTGAETWRSSDGVTWHQISEDGWGDSNNVFADYFDKAAVVFKGALFVGTYNEVDGGEIWQLLSRQVYLPLILMD
jgi:hypothetical protein